MTNTYSADTVSAFVVLILAVAFLSICLYVVIRSKRILLKEKRVADFILQVNKDIMLAISKDNYVSLLKVAIKYETDATFIKDISDEERLIMSSYITRLTCILYMQQVLSIADIPDEFDTLAGMYVIEPDKFKSAGISYNSIVRKIGTLLAIRISSLSTFFGAKILFQCVIGESKLKYFENSSSLKACLNDSLDVSWFHDLCKKAGSLALKEFDELRMLYDRKKTYVESNRSMFIQEALDICKKINELISEDYLILHDELVDLSIGYKGILDDFIGSIDKPLNTNEAETLHSLMGYRDSVIKTLQSEKVAGV